MRGLRFYLFLSWLVWTALALCDCAAEDRSAFPNRADASSDATVDGTTHPEASTNSDGSGNSDGETPDAEAEAYAIRGYVTGLKGTGLKLAMNGEVLDVAPSDGGLVQFAFTKKLEPGTIYTVTVENHPTNPPQICGTTGGTGHVGAADVTDVEVNCETYRYSIGGQVLGLRGSGLKLQNNGTDDLPVNTTWDAGTSDAADAAPAPPVPFIFGAKIEIGEQFNVTVATQPSNPSQTCTPAGAQGTVVSGDVSTVTVNCTTNAFTIGGTVEGLAGSGLKLKNNDTDEIPVNVNGEFSFPIAVSSGETYSVSISAQPTSPWQTCVLTDPGGSVGGAPVTSVKVVCTTNSYVIGGGVTGLSDAGSGVKLTNNGVDEITVNQDGPFAFPTKVPSGQGYKVEVSQQPTNPWQQCDVADGSASVMGSDAKNVAVTCATRSFSLGGAVSGLVGSGLKLTNNGGDEKTITQNGDFTFTTPVLSGTNYNVQVSAQPVGSICGVTGGATGTMMGAAVTSVAVGCNTGTVVGGTSTASTQPVPPNTVLARSIAIGGATTIYALGGYWANSNCTVKYALYSDSLGAPGALLGSTGAVTTTATGASEAVLTSAVPVIAGTYWIALLSQTACQGHYAPTGGTGYVAKVSPVTFASPFPNPYGASVAGGTDFDISLFTRNSP